MKKYINKTLLAIITSVFVVSCTGDFLDVNDNPNNPSVSTPELTLPPAQQEFARLNGTDMTYLGQYIMYNWATPSDWSADQQLMQYSITTNFYNEIFTNSYASIFKNLTYIESFGGEGSNYEAYYAISSTIKGFQYQYLVDLYGNVPYTEANQRAENTTPVYDDEEFIYKEVIASLTSAANIAVNISEETLNPGTQDIIFAGDMQKWAQFANTIKLRMLIRMSNAGQDSYIQEQIGLIEDNGAGYITEDVTANPGYSNDTNKQNPFYGELGFSPNGAETNSHDNSVATDYTVEYLQNTNDPRLGAIYAPSEAAEEFKGAPQNISLPGEGFQATDLSKIGSGLLKAPDQDQPIMLLSEALFLQSEAVIRGYISGDAQQLYEEAITASFNFLEVEEIPSDYYSQSIENVGWDSSPDKIEAIITQKWIALNGTSSIESWIEHTRTGFPEGLPISESATDTRRPIRLLYPTSEYSRNSDNVPSRSQEDAFTNDPFWR